MGIQNAALHHLHFRAELHCALSCDTGKKPGSNFAGTPRNPCIDILIRRGKNIDSFGK